MIIHKDVGHFKVISVLQMGSNNAAKAQHSCGVRRGVRLILCQYPARFDVGNKLSPWKHWVWVADYRSPIQKYPGRVKPRFTTKASGVRV